MYLTLYNESHKSLIANYCLSERKLRYVREPQIAVNDSQRFSVLAFEDGLLVNFFTLHRCSDEPYDTNCLVVEDISTDYRHLRKGHATRALQLLPEFVKEHFPEVTHLILLITEDKNFTRSLCKYAGFEDTGNPSIPIGDGQVSFQTSI
ncbi:GNAT family N-acetyltransferase [Enterococcus sp. DIV0242_7C1]|uniref:N-acetyltransferase domain-containing protein n=1 Tax=Candidatus Enterococcus dunnyi TaxID=1834192 RepID=A0A200J6D7_9ENTE|nr:MULTISPECIES: GNAT family N-acetyltransferase [unclassified Enterococcus]MBO0471581.1 GNAT family N-acetyltransferase [Enterococcus sp. DIV0242_7C1]OUZ32744.1 hypothetical protein A5889_001453 [Enterococcus sp. 9D6_DIV0238]